MTTTDKSQQKSTKQQNTNEINENQVEKKETSKTSRKKEIPNEVKQELNFLKKLQELQQEFHEKMKPLRELETKLKAIEKQYNQDMMTIYKSKNKRSGDKKKTGFVLKVLLPEGMAKLIGEKVGVKMSLPEYTKRFYQVLDQRNLRYQENKKVFRADDEIMNVFNLPQTVNTSTDANDKNGFNFITLQKIFNDTCRGAPRYNDKDELVEKKQKTDTNTTTTNTTTTEVSTQQKQDNKQKIKTVVTVTKNKKQPVAEQTA